MSGEPEAELAALERWRGSADSLNLSLALSLSAAGGFRTVNDSLDSIVVKDTASVHWRNEYQSLVIMTDWIREINA